MQTRLLISFIKLSFLVLSLSSSTSSVMMTKRSTDATMLQERTEYDYVPIEQPDQPDDIPNDEYTFPFQDPPSPPHNTFISHPHPQQTHNIHPDIRPPPPSSHHHSIPVIIKPHFKPDFHRPIGFHHRPQFGPPPVHQDQEAWLSAHNVIRRRYKAPDLTWSPTLARAAKVESDTCVWQHTVNNVYGENIAAGQHTPQEVVQEWYIGRNEKESYHPSEANYSHFTQVIWKSTTEVGCAMTVCNSMKGLDLPQSPIYFWACEYNPPGNVEGEFATNVIAGDEGAEP